MTTDTRTWGPGAPMMVMVVEFILLTNVVSNSPVGRDGMVRGVAGPWSPRVRGTQGGENLRSQVSAAAAG